MKWACVLSHGDMLLALANLSIGYIGPPLSEKETQEPDLRRAILI
jgi:hypothetical protein